MSAVLQVKGLTVRYRVGGPPWNPDTTLAADDVNLSVKRGQTLALVGASGSGKSTVAKAILRLLDTAAGSILLDGHDVLQTEPRGASRAYRKRVQMVFQDPFSSLNPVHPVLHHLARPLRLHRQMSHDSIRAEAIALLEQCGLSPGAEFVDRFPHALSGGQRQRVAIARALASKPDVLVADEPTSMLDMSIRSGVLHLLRERCSAEGLAMLLITHDLGAARQIADQIAVMNEGRIVELGPTEQVLRAPAHAYTQSLLAAARRDRPLTARAERTP